MKLQRKIDKQLILLLIVIIFHSVGLIGLFSESRSYFLELSPLNLLLSMTCLMFSIGFSYRLLVDILIVGIIGFLAEWIGVHTHWLFGDYNYGESLGWKWQEIPLIISINWVMLSFSSIACIQHLSLPIWVKALASALLMTSLDFLIEPVAIQSDFWSWADGYIPIYNYVCWFFISFPLHFYLLKRGTTKQNSVTIGLFIVLIVFFSILNIR